MLRRLAFLLLYFLTWILFFQAARLLFLLYHWKKAGSLPGGTLALSFLYGLRMDASMTAYLLVPVCLFVIAGLYLPFFRKLLPYKAYSLIVLFPLLLLVLCDLEVYSNWGFRIDTTPLRFLSTPREAWASVSHLPLIPLLLGFLLVYLLFAFLFIRVLRRILPLLLPVTRRLALSLGLLLATALLIIPIRGGLQLVPMNQSSVYFSRHDFANITAINAPWNFLYGLLNESKEGPAYTYLPEARARAVVDSLYRQKGEDGSLFLNPHPNVIVVVWESFTEKATHQVVNGVEVTPRFNTLKKEGIYFSRAYASGDRTDKGLAAVLSGYPALNNFSIIRQPAKSARIQSLGKMFRELGYHNSFFYGGEPEFGNIKSYLLQGGYDQLVEKSAFHGAELNSKWGAHDGVVSDRIRTLLSHPAEPFFLTWLTLSSHEPFETPVPTVIPGKDNTSRFLNSLHYADESVYQLVQWCQGQPWWQHTVLVIVADHGHPLIEPSTTLDNFKIPMLWLGGALNRRGVTDERVVSQLDIASSLEAQLAPGGHRFPFSRNLFDSSGSSWAYFSYHSGFGFVQPDRAFTFDNIGRRVSFNSGPLSPADLEAGKAMQQVTYGDYLKK